MKVAKYSASGTTHSNGADTTSVARCCVTPSSSADGTSASPIHSARRDERNGRLRFRARFARSRQRPANACVRAHGHERARRPRSPPPSRSPEQLRVASGSTSRYASSPSRLPALLAEYRKYGSLALGSFVRENHCCRSGAVAESAKNGRPTVPASARSTHHRGSAPAGSPISIGSGSMTLATISTADVDRPLPPSATRVLSAWA